MRGVRAAPTAPGQAARFRQVFACRHHPTALSAPSCRLNLAGAPAACSRRPLSKPCWTSFKAKNPDSSQRVRRDGAAALHPRMMLSRNLSSVN